MTDEELGGSKMKMLCPFCKSAIAVQTADEFPCPICRQLCGVVRDGKYPRVVRAAPDTRKPYQAPKILKLKDLGEI